MSSLRMQRVNELIKREVGEIVRRDLNTAATGLITVTDAEVSSDLKTAKIFYSVVGSPAQQHQAAITLLRHRVSLQQQMARTVILKYTPILKFLRDDSLEYGARIMQILNEIEAAQAPAPVEPAPNPPAHEKKTKPRKKS